MGLRYRKSIKIGKNTRINLSKSGAGISTGVKGARVSVGPRGVRQTVGIPGTGIYYTKEHSQHATVQSKVAVTDLNSSRPAVTGAKAVGYKFLAILLFCLAAFLFIGGLTILPIGLIFWACAAGIAFGGHKVLSKTKRKAERAEKTESMMFQHRQIDTKIVGVTFDDRQDSLRECSEGTDILVVNTPSDKYPHAMGVYTLAEDDNELDFTQPRKTKNLLGYLNDGLAKEIYENEKRIVGDQCEIGPFPGEITEITGGTEDKPTLGCNIRVFS